MGCGGRTGWRCLCRLAATSSRCVRNLPGRHDKASCGASGGTWPCASIGGGDARTTSCLLTVLGRRARCPGLTVVGCFTSTVGRTHSTPRTPPTAQSPLHHSNSSLGRARPRAFLRRLSVRSRRCDTLATLGCLLLSQVSRCCCVTALTSPVGRNLHPLETPGCVKNNSSTNYHFHNVPLNSLHVRLHFPTCSCPGTYSYYLIIGLRIWQ